MRDLNDEVLTNPFDDPLKQIVTAFAKLLKPMVETVDRHGLKKHFLRKHLTSVERFYRQLTNRLPERSGFEMQGTLCPKSGQALHISELRWRSLEQQQCRACNQSLCETPGCDCRVFNREGH